MILTTPRLILRPWQEDDAESLYKYASDPRVGPNAGWPVHTSIDHSLSVIRSVLSSPETYAVVLRPTGEAVGSIGLSVGRKGTRRVGPRAAELGYWIGAPYWGMGYIPEAADELIRRAFEDLGMRVIWCGCYEDNARSARVQEKCGFVYHDTIYDATCTEPDRLCTEHFSRLTRRRWRKISKGKD